MPLRDFSQQENILAARGRFEVPLMMTVWLGIAALSLVEGTIFYLFAGTLAVGVNLVAVRSHREIYLSRWYVNIAAVGAGGVLLLEIFVVHLSLVMALGHYLILIQICKLFEHKTNRNCVQVLALSMLVIVSAAMQSETLLFAIALTAYLIGACYTAMVFTLKRGLDAAASARLITEPTPMDPHRLAWNVLRDWPLPKLRRQVVTVVAIILATGTILFLLTGRMRSATSVTDNTTTGEGGGIPKKVKLGQRKRIQLSDRVLMRISTSGDVDGYLRGRVYYHYKDSCWSASTHAPFTHRLLPPPESILAGAIRQEVTMGAELLPIVFSDQPIVYVTSPTATVSTSGDDFLLSTTSTETDQPIRYTAYVLPRPLTPQQKQYLEGCQPERRSTRASTQGRYTERRSTRISSRRQYMERRRAEWQSTHMPVRVTDIDTSDNVKTLARQWCKDLLSQRRETKGRQRDEFNVKIAERLVDHLRQRCTYTLDLSDANPKIDGVEDFLFHLRRGHCEYFASALTVMCRSLDVPARMAAGFYIPELAPGAQYPVLQRDAHAWTEIYTTGDGWMTFDATPPGKRYSRSDTGWDWKTLSGLWASLERFWRNKIISYDANTRARLGQWIGQIWKNIWTTVTETAAALKKSFVNLLILGYVDEALYRLAIAAALAAAVVESILLLRLLRRRRRRRSSLCAGGAVPLEQFIFARRLFNMLTRSGKARPANQTPRLWAMQTAVELNLPVDAVGELVDLYYRLRWGHAPLDPRQLHQANLRLAELSAAIGRRPGKRTKLG